MARHILIAHHNNPSVERIRYDDTPGDDLVAATLTWEHELALDYYDATQLALAVAIAVDAPHLQDWLDALAMAYRHSVSQAIASALPEHTHAYIADLD